MGSPTRSIVVIAAILTCIKSQEHFTSKEFLVTYELEYPEGDCNTEKRSAPSAMKLRVPRGSSALYVMEKAANEDVNYKFITTYFGSQLGYYVDEINKVPRTDDYSCSWYFYVVPQKGLKPRRPQSGVSNYLISNNKTKIILRYEGQQKPQGGENHEREASRSLLTFGVKYNVLYPDPKCPRSENDTDEFPTAYINVPRGSSALDLVEQVKDDYPESSTITLTYYENYEGENVAYFVDAFNGNMQTPYCFWAFLYEPPGEYAYLVKVGVANFIIPEHGGQVFLRFQTSGYSGLIEPEDNPDAEVQGSDEEQVGSDEEAKDVSDQKNIREREDL